MKKKLKEHIEKIIPLTEDEFLIISSYFVFEKYQKNEFLIKQGKSADHCYFVVTGLLKLFYDDKDGKQHIISFAMEDWWESDFAAYFSKTKANMSLQCIEDISVFSLSLESYHKLCTKIPKMERFFLQKSISGQIASQNRILSFLTSNAKERYEQLLKQYPLLFQRVPKTLLASYLGVSRETLSRLSS
ncbi:transcriptional regulator, Crp/Fnr family [Formosa agariphila KMM 3901]|uniref:Transcriptional regulator, Crp/Fnr family n=1 Tax=Formosa agariphila (strain DSM 15362 / KCTC 12365 / LMG 23005 / KMM 3901 / M-2Alg 35-1) TaxID=1347342 RepID=T2KP75_FORAG|nr:Crp/Fnr family transcriptional regulator [Formosa agariphila]CDF80268.1 transcriptional regulator, Crp/Fnr family [Formosa agariphila KMM 3901]